MIEATYAINEYLTPFLQLVEPRISFFPGDNAHDDRGHSFILYDTIQTQDYDLLGLHCDYIVYRCCHVNYDTAQKLASCIMQNLNLEDPENIIKEPTVRFQYTHADMSGTIGAVFADNTEYTKTMLRAEVRYTAPV